MPGNSASGQLAMFGSEPVSSAPRRILIVEDNELNMKLLNDVLEAHGYDIVKTGHGREAVELAQREQPHLILMDLQLPDFSGLDATRRIKGDPATRGIPIIAVTAFAMAGDERRALENGCDAYLAKPFTLRRLLDLVGDFIGPAPRPSTR
jgi:two-component system cell cycle response regulator DivK